MAERQLERAAAAAQTIRARLPAVLAQESLVSVMTAAFNLGVHGSLNVTQYITETVGVLNMSLGY